jgi:hypothetical protein
VRCTVMGHDGNRVDGWWAESCCSGSDFGLCYGRDRPTQRFDVSAARGAVLEQGGERREPGLDSRGRVPTSIVAGSQATPLSAVSFACSGADAGRQGGVLANAVGGE